MLGIYIMEATDKLALLRQQTNARQTKYYQAHKAQILAKKQTEREQLKELNKPAPEPVILPTEYTLEMIQAVFTDNCSNANTCKKYQTDMKRIFTLCNIQFFTTTIDTYNGVKETLDGSKYSLSTRRGCIQSILVFIDKSGIVIEPKITALYSVLYEVYGIRCTDQNNTRKTNSNDEVMDYDGYMKIILDNYDIGSKEYLIVSLYNECCMRDDFGSIRLIYNLAHEKYDNCIYINNNKCTIIMNQYKTSTTYRKQLYELSDELNNIVINYIVNHNITDYLFPECRKLSPYITNMNKKIGMVGCGINYIRHSKISSFLSKPDLTAEERHDFAVRSGHTEETQKYYRRLVKGVLDESLQQFVDKK